MFKKITQELSRSLNLVALSIPVCIGFGEISGLGALSGVIGLVIALLLGVLMKGADGIIRTPLISLTLIISLIISESEFPQEYKIVLIFYSIILAGFIQVAIGKLGLSKYVKLIPLPVINGALSSMGFLGMSLSISHIFNFDVIESSYNLQTLIIVVLSITTAILFERNFKKVPSLLMALIIPTIICLGFGFSLPQIQFDINNIKLPPIHLFSEVNFGALIRESEYAIILAFTAIIETLLCALIIDNISGNRHNGEKELVSLGASNILSGLAGGLPIGGNTIISIVNVKEKNRNKFRIVLAAIIITFMIPIFGDQLKRIPTAAISAIVIYLSYRIIDWKSLSVAITERKPDHFILITTILIGSFYSILGAILIGFVLASILFMYKMSIVVETMTEEGAVDDFIDNHKIEDSLLDDIRIINLNGPLFFGYADSFYGLFQNLNHIKVIIINLKDVPYMDDTGLEVISKTIHLVQENKIDIYFVGANDIIFSQFEKEKIVRGLLPENSFFPRLKGCLKMLNSEHKEN